MANDSDLSRFELIMKQHFGATEVLRDRDSVVVVGGMLDGERFTRAFLYDMTRTSSNFAKTMQWLLERAEQRQYAKYAMPSFGIVEENSEIVKLLNADRRYAPAMGSVNDVQRASTPFWRTQVIPVLSGEPGSVIQYRPTTAGEQKPKPKPEKPKEPSLDKPVVPKRHFT